MTVTEAAKRWGLATGTVRRAIREGRLVATRSGGTWLVAHAEMVATYGEPKGGRSEQ